MNNYKNMLAFICISAALAACEKKTHEPVKMDSATTVSLDRYAAELVEKNKPKLLSHSAAIKTQVSPLSYLTDFSTDDPTMLTGAINEGDKSSFEKNSAITEKWHKLYCTNTLQSLMQETGIAITSARLIDSFGKAYSVAMCTAVGQKALPPLSSGSAQTDTGQFSLGQICKAGLSVVYGRDTSIMAATTNGNQVQVKYTRPTDGQAMSYRCKLDRGHILTWDDSLVGARWYGAALGDTKLEYRVIGDRLVIQDIVNGRVSNEKSYSLAEIREDN